jgi:hypothetical protein
MDLALLLAGLAGGTIAGLDKIIPEIRPKQYLDAEQITYQDVIAYFREERPNDVRIEAGALLRRPDIGGVILYHIFLDGDDGVVADEGVLFGRAVRAHTIDDELNSRFGSTDLIIFR